VQTPSVDNVSEKLAAFTINAEDGSVPYETKIVENRSAQLSVTKFTQKSSHMNL
jgi:hypothetical protein